MSGLSMCFVIGFFSFPLIAFLFFSKLGMPLNRLNIITFTVVSLFAFSYIGILPLFFEWFEYRVSIGIIDKSQLILLWFMSMWGIFGLLPGVFVGQCITNGALGTHAVTPGSVGLSQVSRLLLCLAFVLCCLVLYLYLRQVPKLAILSALSGDVRETITARSIMTNDFPGKYHRYTFFMHAMASLIAFISFSEWLTSKRMAMLALFSMAYCIFAFLASVEKAPVLFFAMGLYFCYAITRHQSVVKFRYVLVGGIVIMSVVSLMYAFFMGSRASFFGRVLQGVDRIMSGGIGPAYFYLEMFPGHHDYLWGTSFPNPGGVLPFTPYPLTQKVSNLISPDQMAQGVVGSSPAVYWAEMYVNFGWAGWFIAPMIMGIVLVCAQLLVRSVKTPSIRVGLMVFLMLHYQSIAVTGISTFLFDLRLLFILAFVAGLVLVGPLPSSVVLSKRLSSKTVPKFTFEQ